MLLNKNKEDLDFATKKLLSQYQKFEKDKYSIGKEETWENIISKIEQKKSRKIKKIIFPWFYSAAAILLLFFITEQIFFLKEIDLNKKTSPTLYSFSTKESNTNNKILLFTSEWPQLASSKSPIVFHKDGTADFTYETNNSSKRISIQNNGFEGYNRIISPRGQRSGLTLPDKTSILINSGTEICFPGIFNNKRQLTVNGEVYLDVTSDKNNPFIVKTSDLSIKVLGTAFNINSYKDEHNSSVVLVRGKLEVKNNSNRVVLHPQQMVELKEKELLKSNVTASDHIGWIYGTLILKKEPIQNVFNKLSKYYGENIILKGKTTNLTMSGKLDISENIEEVLEIISKLIPITIQKKENTFIIYSI